VGDLAVAGSQQNWKAGDLDQDNGVRRHGRAQPAQRLVERDRELEALGTRLAMARAGHGNLVLIDAPPGRGKTRLLNAAGDAARTAKMRVLGAQGAELEQAFPFGVALQLFEPLWFAADEPERESLIQGPAWRACDLLTGSITEGEGGATDQGYSIIHGLFWLSCNLALPPAGDAGMLPVAMLVDDVHWADSASLRFLAYLTQRIADLPISLILAVRTGELTADDTAIATIRSSAHAVTVRPAPLSSEGVATVISSHFPDPDPAFCAVSARITGGNPFLVMELLAQVQTDGDLAEAVVADRLAEVPPESVLASVANRLASLSEDSRTVAAALAVLGDGASLRQVARLANLDPAAASRAADALAGAHFLSPGSPLSFVHPLVNAAVKQAIPALDRARAHRLAADILHEDGAPRELIAAHMLEAPADSDLHTIEILRSAARCALAKGAAESAVRMLERAIAEPPPPDLYPELLSELAEAEVAAGLPHAVNRLEDAISVIEASPKRARLALTQGRALIDSGRYHEATEVLEAARTDVDDQDPQLAQELDAAYVAAAYGVPELAERAAACAAAIRARVEGRPNPTQREVLAHMAIQAAFHGHSRSAVVDLAELAWDGGTLADEDGPWERAGILVTSALMFADELERDLELCEAAMNRASERSSPTSFAAASYLRAWPRYHQGLVNEAAADAQAALDVRLDRWEVYARSAYGAVASGHIQRAELDEAETALSLLDHPSVSESVNAPFLLEARAQLHLAAMRPEDALVDALEAGRLLKSTIGAVSPGVIPWRSTAALAHLALGETSRAWDLAAEELESARRADITRIVMRDLRVQGLTLRGADGIDLLAQAVEIGDGYGRRLEHIHALVDLGAALRRSNRRAAAREPLVRALDLARSAGLSMLAERAKTELQASGARARRSMLSGPEALTPSQRRVADLAAQGLTTRMIAESLFVTPKTVEFHLRQIYQKLEISSRAELAASLESGAADDARPRNG
jgi:DNA-binding CsgD family transcriptional regulator